MQDLYNKVIPTMACSSPTSAEARYFVAKCASIVSLRRCITSGKWASRERVFPPQPHDILTSAFSQGPVILIFSVNNCHGWHGYCSMTSSPKRPDHVSSPAASESLTLKQQNVGHEEKPGASKAEGELNMSFESGDSLEKTETKDVRNLPNKAAHETSHITDKESVPKEGNVTSFKQSVTTDTGGATHMPSQNITQDETQAQDTDTRSQDETANTWHYFDVKWHLEFLSNFGETCLPSSKTISCLLPDGSPLNKARNWQELSADVGHLVCSLLDEMHVSLVEKRRKQEEAKLAAKPPPFIEEEGELQNKPEQYWKKVVEKVEQELGPVHLACPFGSQRYNLQQPDSDIDAFVVYQAHTKDLLGFNPPKATVKNSDHETCDYTVLELKRYCELLLAYDARCIETFFLDDSTIVQASAEWRQLQKLRPQFLTRKCLEKYLGDALGSHGTQKLYRTLENSTVSGEQSPPPRVAKLLYIIIRLLQNALNIVKGEPLQVFRPCGSAERNMLLGIRKADITVDEAKAVIQSLEDQIAAGKDSVTPEMSSLKTQMESWLLTLRFHDFQMHPAVKKDKTDCLQESEVG